MADWIYEVKETGATEWRRVPLREACQRLNLRLKISALGRYLSLKGLLSTIRETGRPTPVPPLSGVITDPLDPGWLRARRPQPGEIKRRSGKGRRSRSVNNPPPVNTPADGRKSKPSPTPLARKQAGPRKARSPRPSKPTPPPPPPPAPKPRPTPTPQKPPSPRGSDPLAKARAAKQAKANLNAKRAAALAKARAAKAARRIDA